MQSDKKSERIRMIHLEAEASMHSEKHCCWKINQHHHQVTLTATSSLTFSRSPSLSFIDPGESSTASSVRTELMNVFAGWPSLVCPCVGIHKRTSLWCSSLLLLQCPEYLVCLTWIAYEMGGLVAIQLKYCE